MKNGRNIRIDLILIAMAIIVAACLVGKKNNTDGPDGASGLVLYHDALTGCEYLGNPLGGITPRLDRSGKQICGAAQ